MDGWWMMGKVWKGFFSISIVLPSSLEASISVVLPSSLEAFLLHW